MRSLRRILVSPHLLVVAAAIVFAGGCRDKSSSQSGASRSAATSDKQSVAHDALLTSALQLLQQARETWQAPIVPTPEGPKVSAPRRTAGSTDSFLIAAQSLNQYVTAARADGKELIAPVNPDLQRTLARRLSERQLEHMESPRFDSRDSMHLEMCFTHRDIAERVTAGLSGDLPKAEALFDWLVRNVQLDPEEQAAPIPLSPVWTLLLGRGSELERAWVFAELLRQANIESVLLAYVETDPANPEPRYVPWLPAALIDDALYLFDTRLGLPVPGADGRSVATLGDVLADPSLLDGLALDDSNPYRVRPEQLLKLVVLYPSSPTLWAPRMRFLQEQLAGQNRVVLWSDLEALAQQTRIAAGQERAIDQDLWGLPVTLDEIGRSKEYVEKLQELIWPYLFFEPVSQARRAHLRGKFSDAVALYLDNRKASPELGGEASRARKLYNWVREDCTYFLGLLKFDQRDYEAASDWFGRSYLERYPDGKFVGGARYNLGRCAEAQSQFQQAIENYTAVDSGPQMVGNLIRARRLGWKPQPDTPASAEPAAGANESDHESR